MAKVKIQGHASGTGVLTVTAPNTSTDRTITLPDATGTLATTADTGVAGITSNADATAITIDSSENVGIGVVPETWDANYDALQVGGNGSLAATPSQAAGGKTLLGQNMYVDSSYKYISTDEASLLYQQNGAFKFRVAASGSADAAITWTDAFEVLNAGQARAKNGLLFGTDTAAANALDDYEEGTFSAVFKVGGTDNVSSTLRADYTKIGRQVTCYYGVSLINSTNGSGALTITGFPFTSSSTKAVNCILSGNDKVNFPNLVGRMNGTTMHFYYHSSSTSSNLTVADGSAMNGNSAGKQFEVQVTYTV